MFDPSLRPRRRVRDSTGGAGHSLAPPSQYGDTPLSVGDLDDNSSARNAFSVVFSANPSALWNSAQETFSSIPSGFSIYGGLSGEEAKVDHESPTPNSFVQPLDLNFNMPSRDRTYEFRTTAKSYLMKVQVTNQPSKQNTVLQSRQFNQLAQKIGRDLSQTCAKMEKLAEVTKRKSVFEDRSEVEHLSRIIREDMTSLNQQIAALQEFSRSSQPAGQTAGHSQLVVVGLQSKLATVSKDFQSVLEQRSENLREQRQRRQKFSSQADLAPLSLPSSSSQPNVRSRLLEDVDGNGAVSLDMDSLEQHRTQGQLLLNDDSVAYANARSSTMETIESSISELGQIFSQLAHLVAEQGEMITRIDSNVEETSLNVDAAHSELVKYFHSISQNRWLMIKVFGVLMVFFVVFVLFLT